MAPDEKIRGERRVTLWFGQHVLRNYRAEAGAAQQYASAIGRRFPGLEVTVDDILTDELQPLPCEQLWEVLTP